VASLAIYEFFAIHSITGEALGACAERTIALALTCRILRTRNPTASAILRVFANVNLTPGICIRVTVAVTIVATNLAGPLSATYNPAVVVAGAATRATIVCIVLDEASARIRLATKNHSEGREFGL
jgi:hypothetical protein